MIKVTAIVTRSKNFGENKKLINLFTPEMGMILATVHGATSTKGGKALSSQLFTCGEYVLSERNGYYSVSGFTLIEAFPQICHDYDRYCSGVRMLKCVNSCMYTSDSDAAVYELLVYSLYSLANCAINHTDILIFFLLRLMSLIGFCPTVTTCASCGCSLTHMQEHLFFSVDDGGAICQMCAGETAYSVTALELEIMRRLLLLDYNNIGNIIIPEKCRGKLMQILTAYAVTYLEEPKILTKP